jgi:hypothetical protein
MLRPQRTSAPEHQPSIALDEILRSEDSDIKPHKQTRKSYLKKTWKSTESQEVHGTHNSTLPPTLLWPPDVVVVSTSWRKTLKIAWTKNDNTHANDDEGPWSAMPPRPQGHRRRSAPAVSLAGDGTLDGFRSCLTIAHSVSCLHTSSVHHLV